MSSSLTVRGLDARAVQSFYDIGLVQNYFDGKILHVGHPSLLSQRVSSVLPNALSLLEPVATRETPSDAKRSREPVIVVLLARMMQSPPLMLR